MNRPADIIIGVTPSITKLRAELQCAAQSDAKVLLTGESGVGKDIAARVIHQLSARHEKPFAAINCVSVPDSLLEAELFGHVRGSFTGAYRDRPGLFEAAHRGTVLLDEVCEMTPRMQAMLLRFLDTGEIQRVGSDSFHSRVDIRVLAATNRNPEQFVADKIFRADLYYRLNVIDIRVPPLRDRREDVPVLLEHFLQTYAVRHRLAKPTITPDALDVLMSFDWPGNVRQLKNIAERLVVRAKTGSVSRANLPDEITVRHAVASASAPATPPVERSPIDDIFDRMVKQRESFWSAVYPAFRMHDLTRDDVRFIIKRGLQQTAGNYKMLVSLLNMDPGDYRRFMNFLRKHGCQLPFARFRSAELRRGPQSEDDLATSRTFDAPPVIDVDRAAAGLIDNLPSTTRR